MTINFGFAFHLKWLRFGTLEFEELPNLEIVVGFQVLPVEKFKQTHAQTKVVFGVFASGKLLPFK